ncbi:MAG: S9 family peptidase [Marinilabiliaceae bacterium]|jgi:dipeptidyl aminopeptidase/acylaminoacyl peptidase|nr:S9 family peptidase [Marinilabiliaceae bacterium]
MKKYMLSALVLVFSISCATAQETTISEWLKSQPLKISKPAFISGPDINGEEYENKTLIEESYINLRGLDPVVSKTWEKAGTDSDGYINIKALRKTEFQLVYLAAYIESEGLNDIKIEVESPQMFEVFLEGEKISSNYTTGDEGKSVKRSGSLDLDQGKFLVVIKSLLADNTESDWKIRAKISELPDKGISVSTLPGEKMNIHHLLEGPKLGSLSISPDGKYVIVNYSEVDTENGKTKSWSVIRKSSDGSLVQSFKNAAHSGLRWMPVGNSIYYTEKNGDYSSIIVCDIEKGQEYAIAENIKDMSGFSWADDCSFIIYNVRESEKQGGKSSLKYMDELGNRRFSPGSYNSLYKYDIKEGVSTRLTYGKPGFSLHDISPDGKSMVFSSSRPNPTQRPFSLQNVYLMDLASGELKTLWEDFRWAGYAEYSPDGKKLLVSGGPDCFGETGRNIGDQKIANNYDGQLYIYDIASGKVDPITRNFNPAVESAVWHRADKRIYITASDEVYTRLFAFDPAEPEFKLIETVPDNISGFNMAADKLLAVYSGTSKSRHNRAWIADLDKGETRLFDNPEANTYSRVKFGKDENWNFRMPDGREIKGYIMYPVDFDPSRKYPLIVNYYGGTSPVEKSFGGRYPMEIWAANGYLVFVPQPSGATGFGQEFSARHQNTWGMDAADEIIEGTKQFLAAHSFADPERVGCIGASYGGFMTMLLQTKTDIFTCAISHAGISSISSYWGEGYWGYVYSSEATGDSYPWNRKDIYIGQSPLFSADKINTPLLLLHGSVDTNVPLGESLQLWVALKILGRPVEMVQVEGEDHHILTYSKRIEWHNTIMAWFAKFLKDDGSDWKELFPKSEL